MEYLLIEIENSNPEILEIAQAALSHLPFEAFEIKGDRFKGYILKQDYNESLIKGALAQFEILDGIGFTVAPVPFSNWNDEWERNFQPVLSRQKVEIRAPHHSINPLAAHSVLIVPRMSFGTGHHSTTALMIEAMLGCQIAGKTVHDVGTGSGVLAILAAMLGAAEVRASDNYPIAVENTGDNAMLNSVTLTEICLADGMPSSWPAADIILANITRNALIGLAESFTQGAKAGSMLFTSGYLADDAELVESAVQAYGWQTTQRLSSADGWVCTGFAFSQPRVQAKPKA